MDVKIEELGPCKKKLSVTVPKDAIQEEFDKGLTELTQHIQIPGFRVGRAPRRLVELRYRSRIQDEIKEKLVTDSLGKALEENGLQPIGTPDVQDIQFDPETALTFNVTMEVKPDFDIDNYKDLKLERKVYPVAAEDINAGLEDLRQRAAVMELSEKPAAEGDLLIVDAKVLVDGKVVYTQDAAELFVSKGVNKLFQAEVGEVVDLFKGATISDTRSVETTLPDTFFQEENRLKKAVLEFTVREVKRRSVPELNDEFAKKLGTGSIEDLRKHVEAQLEIHHRNRSRQELKKDLFDQLLSMCTFELPAGIVEESAQSLRDRREMELRMYGVGPDDIKKREDELKTSSQESSARDLKLFFIIEKIAQKEGIVVEESDAERALGAMAQSYGTHPRRVRMELEKSGKLSELRLQILEDKTSQFLLDQADIAESVVAPADKPARGKKKAAKDAQDKTGPEQK